MCVWEGLGSESGVGLHVEFDVTIMSLTGM